MTNLEPLFKTIIEHVPAPTYDPDEVLQAHVTNLDSSRRSWAVWRSCRIFNGTLKKGQTVAWARHDGEH